MFQIMINEYIMNQFTLNIFTPTIKLVHEVHYNLGYIWKTLSIDLNTLKKEKSSFNLRFFLLNRTLCFRFNRTSKRTIVCAAIITMTEDEDFDMPDGEFSFVTLYMCNLRWLYVTKELLMSFLFNTTSY